MAVQVQTGEHPWAGATSDTFLMHVLLKSPSPRRFKSEEITGTICMITCVDQRRVVFWVGCNPIYLCSEGFIPPGSGYWWPLMFQWHDHIHMRVVPYSFYGNEVYSVIFTPRRSTLADPQPITESVGSRPGPTAMIWPYSMLTSRLVPLISSRYLGKGKDNNALWISSSSLCRPSIGPLRMNRTCKMCGLSILPVMR